MKIAVAVDSFKGSMTSYEAGNSVRRGFEKIYPDSMISVIELADGGEGTCSALARALGCEEKTVTVTSPIMGRTTEARYAFHGKTAVIEMAQAAGLPLLSPEDRNPMVTTTYGVGEMIRDALKSGCRDFIIGLGGSATNDAGIGMLTALGFRFSDAGGNPVPPGCEGVGKTCGIDLSGKMPELDECTFTVACDVKNPLFGEKGCSAVFARQKGASEAEIPEMDRMIFCLTEQVTRKIGTDYSRIEGAGAAGGMGFALSAFLGGRLVSGIDLILERSGAEEIISGSDLVITGEGRLDRTSVMGKAPVGVAGIAKKYGKPVIAFCGCCSEEAEICNEYGIDAFFPILREPVAPEEAMKKEYAMTNMEKTAAQAARLFKIRSL